MLLSKGVKPIAYLSCEFAIDSDLPTYAGGLGILAGDTMHAAADADLPVVGIGILYKGKAFVQHITQDGKEEKRDSQFDHDSSFLRPVLIRGKPLTFVLPGTGNSVQVKAYQHRLSDNTILFFLSTDVDGNPPEWVGDMNALYQGDMYSQFRQQLLLGIGGAVLLEKLSIRPAIYHVNEGRPAFVAWWLVQKKKRENSSNIHDAYEEVKKLIVYSNHTILPAANLDYPANVLKELVEPLAQEIDIPADELIATGLKNQHTFSTNTFALKVSGKQSAVSQVHGNILSTYNPQYKWISITNGVHMPRWQDSDFRNPNLNDHELWKLHMAKKAELAQTVTERTGFSYDINKLVVCWARRLAEYKQPMAIFEDTKRLKELATNTDRPVQILFAGNSHAADPNAKGIIEEIIRIMSGELSGSAIFVPNYNMSLANKLVSGSDVWLNTPKGDQEACGTSGMKAAANGVINCTVLDGWTHEVDWKEAGWVLDKDNVSTCLYDLLENEITPLYYDLNDLGLPEGWIRKMRASINIADKYSATNMLLAYKKQLYGVK